MCIVLYFEIISFNFIWNEYLLYQKNHQFREQIFLLEKWSWHQSKATPVSFNATDCRLWSTGSDRSQSRAVNSMQKGRSKIAVVQISGTEYITKCYRNMVDQIPQKRILGPWNQRESHCLHRWPHIWNSRTSGASRHHGAHEGTPAWT